MNSGLVRRCAFPRRENARPNKCAMSSRGRYQISLRDAHQSSLTGLCQSANRGPADHRASDNALRDALAHLALFTERGVPTYPVERETHVEQCSCIEATFNHGSPRVMLL